MLGDHQTRKLSILEQETHTRYHIHMTNTRTDGKTMSLRRFEQFFDTVLWKQSSALRAVSVGAWWRAQPPPASRLTLTLH
ncbi:unnamed protein product [Arctia plantaginis]|uniref:Uncharacterized protein n=1 Tax=Arctia plantaginis TaxID=874455 RepID=A0A8S1AMJ8_ARCPL|nr:unnamed protein product [Arctia plantaginis]